MVCGKNGRALRHQSPEGVGHEAHIGDGIDRDPFAVEQGGGPAAHNILDVHGGFWELRVQRWAGRSYMPPNWVQA